LNLLRELPHSLIVPQVVENDWAKEICKHFEKNIKLPIAGGNETNFSCAQSKNFSLARAHQKNMYKHKFLNIYLLKQNWLPNLCFPKYIFFSRSFLLSRVIFLFRALHVRRLKINSFDFLIKNCLPDLDARHGFRGRATTRQLASRGHRESAASNITVVG
jgi:hypothetical protein